MHCWIQHMIHVFTNRINVDSYHMASQNIIASRLNCRLDVTLYALKIHMSSLSIGTSYTYNHNQSYYTYHCNSISHMLKKKQPQTFAPQGCTLNPSKGFDLGLGHVLRHLRSGTRFLEAWDLKHGTWTGLVLANLVHLKIYS